MRNTSDNYLVTEVMTATPQKLQLMLIDASIRAIHCALQHQQAGEKTPACECIIRAQQIVGEMLAALDYEAKSDLVKKVAGVYLFVYRTLVDAAMTLNALKINDALKVLTVERETWRLLCEKTTGSDPQRDPSKTGHAPIAAHIASNGENMPDMAAGSFSLEA
jgi:flagellar secretion chaperone FliS